MRRCKPVTRFRPFRNTDPPALARIWNQAVPTSATARPLRVHELSTHAWGSVMFEAAGLIVAERDGRIVGFVHAGFGPELPVDAARPLVICRELGTIAMLLVEPGLEDSELVDGLLDAAESYLRRQGAKVLYAGSIFPLNPFYWGIYGGSEGSGVLSGHQPFQRGVLDRGYSPVGSTVLLEADLNTPEPRDPRGALIRRQTHLEFVEDATPAHWWQGLALGEFPVSEAPSWPGLTVRYWRVPPHGTCAGSIVKTDGRASACSAWKSCPDIAAKGTVASSSARSFGALART